LIEKQMKIGNHIREKKKVKEDNRRRVKSVQNQRSEVQIAMPLKTKVYGGLQFDMDNSTQRSSFSNTNAMTVNSNVKSFKRG
jgi:hypothetical protein